MQEHVQLDQKQINKELLNGVLEMPKWWPGATTIVLIIFITGLGAFGYMLNKGVGVTGLNRPVYWGFFMVNFVFWIGISHAGIMISAILRLTQAEWRRPVTRAAEVLTVFSLMAALMAAPPRTRRQALARRPMGLPLRLRQGRLDQHPLALHMGPQRRHDLPDRQHPVRPRRAAPRPGDHTRPQQRLHPDRLLLPLLGLARYAPPVEAPGSRRHPAVRPRPPGLRLRSQHRVLGLSPFR